MGENFATGVNQKTGRKEYYKTKKDYMAGRATKSKSARQRNRRVYAGL